MNEERMIKMKQIWEKPELDVLDVSMTLKGWKPPGGGGGKDPKPTDPPVVDPPTEFDS